MDRAPPQNALSLNEAQRLAWLRLIRSENVGPSTFRELINHLGSAEAALSALPELSRKGGKKAIRICPEHEARRELEAHAALGARLVALGEADYPPHLRHIDGPPPLLSVRGATALASPMSVALVGARNASLAGQKLAKSIASELGNSGYTVVSGLARGIDSASHQASLVTGTAAVFAGGIDVLYPPENVPLADQILSSRGNLLSEMPFGWKPRARDFPRRNRLISGMSLGVVVIEAAKGSGSLHTARFALEQNREIFAVPGSPLDPRSEGANSLIRQGATLIRHADDVLEALAGRSEPELPFYEPDTGNDGLKQEPAGEPAESDRQRLLQALGPTPVTLDEVIQFTGIAPRLLSLLLLELELAGRLERHGGQKISLLY